MPAAASQTSLAQLRMGGFGAMEATRWLITGAIEHGSFMMAVAAVALGSLTILMAISGVIAYIRIRWKAGRVAANVARATAEEITETTVNLYLQEHLSAILAEYIELNKGGVSSKTANDIARNEV